MSNRIYFNGLQRRSFSEKDQRFTTEPSWECFSVKRQQAASASRLPIQAFPYGDFGGGVRESLAVVSMAVLTTAVTYPQSIFRDVSVVWW